MTINKTVHKHNTVMRTFPVFAEAKGFCIKIQYKNNNE